MPSFTTERPIALSVELIQGMVYVIASDRTDTVVAVNPSDPADPVDVAAAHRTKVDLTNGQLTIRAPKRRGIVGHLGLGRSGSIDVTVELPEASSVHAEAGMADIRSVGELGEVRVRTGAGNVRMDQVASTRVHSGVGRVTVEKSSGDAEIVTTGDMAIGTVTGNADLKNHSGATWLGRVDGDVRVRSSNGDVTIESAGHDVTVKAANGEIRLGRVTRGSTTIETACGGLEIGIEEGSAAWVDASTRFGQIHNTLSPVDDPEHATDTIRIHARTSFGDVLITRPQPGRGDR